MYGVCASKATADTKKRLSPCLSAKARICLITAEQSPPLPSAFGIWNSFHVDAGSRRFMANEASPTKSVATPALASRALTMGVPGFSLLLSPRMPFLRGMQPLWMVACEGGDDGEAAWAVVKLTPVASAVLPMF